MLNRIIIIGRCVRDVEIKYTQSGSAVANFTLAVDRKFKAQDGEKETDFIPVVVWKKLAENCANYLSKGKLASVDGRLQIRNYETQDGQKRTVAEVVAEDVRFLSPRDGAEQSAPRQSESNDTFPESENDLPF